MRIGSLFSGIGGLEWGLESAGLGEVVWQVEQSSFCRSVLARHWPNAVRFQDVNTVGAANLPPVDVICGGFPCQDISAAGKGEGLEGDRSGLWFQFARVVRELQPRIVVIENVTSGANRWVDRVRSHLAEFGYASAPLPSSALSVGALHIRERIFIVAADTNRVELRKQPGGGQRSCGEGANEPPHAGQTRVTSNSNSNSKPAIPIDGEVAGMQALAGPAPTGPIAPEFRGVADGLPDRLDRLKSLGNAVVPQCSREIGEWILLELGGE